MLKAAIRVPIGRQTSGQCDASMKERHVHDYGICFWIHADRSMERSTCRTRSQIRIRIHFRIFTHESITVCLTGFPFLFCGIHIPHRVLAHTWRNWKCCRVILYR